MNIVIKALAVVFIFLPQLVKARQIMLPEKVSLNDTLTQTTKQPTLKLKPTLGKYDYYKSLGIACKAELKLEKATNIPFRFRLGSLQQTDYMEGKPNAQKPESK